MVVYIRLRALTVHLNVGVWSGGDEGKEEEGESEPGAADHERWEVVLATVTPGY